MMLGNRIACRICLSTNVKFYHLEAFELKSYYEEIINVVLTKDDKLLHFFCYQCSAMLQKYNKFRRLCIKSQESLKRIITHNFNIPFEVTLKWEQYNNKIQPSIRKLDSTAKLGYFEYCEENDMTVIESLDEPLVNHSIPYKEGKSAYFDSEEKFDSNFFVGEHNSINDASENDFEECKTILCTNQESKNVDKSMSSVSDRKQKSKKPKSSIAKSDFNGRGKKKLDPTKWKKVILTNEEALKLIHAKIQKQRYTFKHVCEHCQKAFEHIKKLSKHMSCHSEANGKYECFFCKKRYRAKWNLIRHIPLHLERYHCLQCPAVFCSIYQTRLHDKYHEGVQYACPHCDAKFKKKASYYSHLRLIHRSCHLCQFCGASFVNQLGLMQHKAYFHKSNDTVEKGIYCEQCDMTFVNSDAFREHERNSAKHGIEEEKVPGQSIKLLKRNNIEYRECDQCAEQFTSLARYYSHMLSAHNVPKPAYNPRSTICEICGSSVLLCHLELHMDMHKGKRYPCPDCDKVYSHMGNMQRHRRHHKNPRPFSCDLCGKTFTQKSSVQLHVRTVHLKQPHPPRNRTRMKFAALGKSDEL